MHFGLFASIHPAEEGLYQQCENPRVCTHIRDRFLKIAEDRLGAASVIRGVAPHIETRNLVLHQ